MKRSSRVAGHRSGIPLTIALAIGLAGLGALGPGAALASSPPRTFPTPPTRGHLPGTPASPNCSPTTGNHGNGNAPDAFGNNGNANTGSCNNGNANASNDNSGNGNGRR